jgi:hypothetical protein
MLQSIRRRTVLSTFRAIAALTAAGSSLAQQSRQTFREWVKPFVPERARGVSDATYSRVMDATNPDTSV